MTKWKNQSGNKAWLESNHEWENDDGYIDTFVTESDIHNGPRCTKCGFTDCWHCVGTPPPCKGKK